MFYLSAPFVLMGMFFYLHIYLQRMWEGLASLPAIFPDGRRLDERAYPWMLSGLVQGHVERLRKNRPPLSRLQGFVSVFFAWMFVPLTILAMWWRYLPTEDSSVFSWLLVAVATVACGSAMRFYLLTRSTLRQVELGGRTTTPGTALVFALLVTVVTAGFTMAALYGP